MISSNVVMPNGMNLDSTLTIMDAKLEALDVYHGVSYIRFQDTITYDAEDTSSVFPFKPRVFSSRGDIPYDPDEGLFYASPGQMYLFASQFVLNTGRRTWSRVRHWLSHSYDGGTTWSDIVPTIRSLNIDPPLTSSGSSVTPTLAETRAAFPLSLQIISYSTANMPSSDDLLKFGQAFAFETGGAYPIELGYYGIMIHLDTWES